MTWGTGVDMEELRVQLKDTRIIRLALDSLEEHLPTELASDTEVEEPAFGLYGGWGSRVSPVWARNPSMRAGRYWICLSRFLMIAAS